MNIEASRSAFGALSDRFIPRYRRGYGFEEQLDLLRDIPYVDAIPVTYARGADPALIRGQLSARGLRAGTVVPDLYADARFMNGTLASRDETLRKELTAICAEAMDFCHEVGGVDVMLWLAHDGYDYPFEDDYARRWDWIAQSLHSIASHRPDVRATIEYKPSEPRAFQYISNAGKAVAMCEQVGLANLGVILDFGHALMAGENPAESAAFLHRFGRLFHIHLNDNYGRADDDLMIAGAHLWQTLDFFYQLQRVEYQGWHVMDIWSPRMDGVAMTNAFVRRARALWRIAEELPRETIRAMQTEGDATGIYNLLTERVLRAGEEA